MLARLIRRIKILYFKTLILFGWNYQTRIFKVLMEKSSRKKSFIHLIEALSQKQLFKLLELEVDEYGGIFHLIAMYGDNLDILSILIEKIPQKVLCEFLYKEKVNGYEPFYIAASFNLEMMLFLVKEMSSDQLYNLLTMGFPYHATPFNYIMWEYERGTEIGRNVVNTLIKKLSDSQFFNLISDQLKFEKGCSEGLDNAVLEVKVSPKNSSRELREMNKFKEQMLRQLCTYIKLSKDHSFPHTELYDENSYVLRTFLVQMKSEELYRAMKDYDGYILYSSLLHKLLKHYKLEFDSSYAISGSKCFELISREKRYGYTFYQTESSDHFTMLVSMKKLPKVMYRYNVQQPMNNAEFLSDKDGVPAESAMAILGCIMRSESPFTLKEDLGILEALGVLKVVIKIHRCLIYLTNLLNLYMLLIDNTRTYKEQVYVNGSWIGHRALPNIEKVSVNANEVAEKGKKIYIGGKELIKYKNRMYEYQEILCLGAKTIEMLIDNCLFSSCNRVLSNLHLQTISLSDQKSCEQQRKLSKQLVKSGDIIVNERENFKKVFSQVLSNVFCIYRNWNKTSILLLLSHSFIEVIINLSTAPHHLKMEHKLLLINNIKELTRCVYKLSCLQGCYGNFAEKILGKNVVSELRKKVSGLYFVEECHKKIRDLGLSSIVQRLNSNNSLFFSSDYDLSLFHEVHKYLEESNDRYTDCQNSLIYLLCTINIDQETVELFLNDNAYADYFDQVVQAYAALEGKPIMKEPYKYRDNVSVAHNNFQSSCHEITHKISEQIYKQSKGKQSINSKLEDSFISNLSQKASKSNVIR